MSSEEPMGEETRLFLEQYFPSEYLQELKAVARYHAGRKAGLVDPSSIVIDAVLKAARNRDQLEDAGKLKAWMKTILVREVMARLQLEGCRRTQDGGADNLQHVPQKPAEASSVEREDEQSWAKAYLWRLLSLISEGDREVICLSRVQGMPDADAAELLGVTEATLRQRRSRAMKRLRELAKQFPPR